MQTRNYEITIHDAKTGETLTRVMTENERAAYDLTCDSTEANAQAKAAKAAARQAVLDKLGLTANEAQALLG
jgi:hypothetical protein